MKEYRPSIHIKKKNDINNNNNTFYIPIVWITWIILPILHIISYFIIWKSLETYISVVVSKMSSILDQCRILAFPSTLFFVGERFVNHTITNINVIDRDTCEYSCYFNHNCVSVNFHFGPSEAGIQNCELNNSTSKEHDKDLVKATNYVYHGTKVRRQCL